MSIERDILIREDRARRDFWDKVKSAIVVCGFLAVILWGLS